MQSYHITIYIVGVQYRNVYVHILEKFLITFIITNYLCLK